MLAFLQLMIISECITNTNLLYRYFLQAKANDLLIKSNKTKDILIGKAWPGKTAFLDFKHPGTQSFWLNALKGLYNEAAMDGIWLDLDEATNFCKGECPNDNFTSFVDDNTSLPFNPTSDDYSIKNRSLSLDAQHYYETDSEKELNIEYNMHSLYGTMMAKTTHQFWKNDGPLSGN